MARRTGGKFLIEPQRWRSLRNAAAA